MKPVAHRETATGSDWRIQNCLFVLSADAPHITRKTIRLPIFQIRRNRRQTFFDAEVAVVEGENIHVRPFDANRPNFRAAPFWLNFHRSSHR